MTPDHYRDPELPPEALIAALKRRAAEDDLDVVARACDETVAAPRPLEFTLEIGCVVLTRRMILALADLDEPPHVVALTQDPKCSHVDVATHDGRQWQVEADGNVHEVDAEGGIADAA